MGSQSERLNGAAKQLYTCIIRWFNLPKQEWQYGRIEREREKLITLPQMRCNDYVFTVLGAGNN